VACREGMFQYPASAQAFHTAAYKRVAFAWFYMLEFNKLVDIVVKLYTEPVFYFCGSRHFLILRCANIAGHSQ